MPTNNHNKNGIKLTGARSAMRQLNGLADPTRLLLQLTEAPVGDAIDAAHESLQVQLRERSVLAGALRAAHALRHKVLVLDALLAVEAVDEFART
jgi:hypothetical protein